jgi:hypothetical protein
MAMATPKTLAPSIRDASSMPRQYMTRSRIDSPCSKSAPASRPYGKIQSPSSRANPLPTMLASCPRPEA